MKKCLSLMLCCIVAVFAVGCSKSNVTGTYHLTGKLESNILGLWQENLEGN